MTSFVSTAPLFDAPRFSPVFIPTLQSLGLSDDERATIAKLQMKGWRERGLLELTDAYYRGAQLITNLGIAIPPELAGLRTVVGWPRIAVDPYVERLFLESFRLPGATDSDQDLTDIWIAAGMDAEQSLAYTDALAMGRGYLTIGSAYEDGDPPQICVESPLNMSVVWDLRTRKPKEALQSYWMEGRRCAALYVKGATIQIGEDDNGAWEVIDRDEHGFEVLPIVRIANRPRSNNRDGASEITPELMSIVDATCRTLLGLEVSRELYSVPQKVLLGASESDFVNADGTAKSGFSTYISRIWAIEPDEEGNVPEIKQMTPYDPSVFTKLVDMYASQAAGILGSPPQDLGLYTDGNPISAEAAQVSEGRRDRRARRMQATFGVPMIETMQISLRFINGGELPDEYKRLYADWSDPQIPNIAGTADALTKYAKEGMIPPTSDVTLKRAGFNVIERARLEADRKVDAGAQVLRELAESEQVKLARATNTVDNNINPNGPVKPNDRAAGNGSVSQ